MSTLGPYWVGDRPRDTVDVQLYRNGQVADLSGYTAASVELYSPAGVLIDTTGTSIDLAVDRVSITWPSDHSLFTAAGIYTLFIVLDTVTSSEHAAELTFEVRTLVDATGTKWATPNDVLTATGITVDTEDIAKAQLVIDSVSSAASLDVTKIGPRDRRFLRLAVAYQAVWMKSQPDLFGRVDVETFSQDGQSATMRNELSAILAPLARQALRRCSWNSNMRTRRMSTRTPKITDPMVSDEHGGWVKL